VALLYEDNTTVLVQPDVNHRALSRPFLNNREFLSRMQQQDYDFSEEMHALVYQVETIGKEKEISDQDYAEFTLHTLLMKNLLFA
jgi:hypothetical protein